MNNTQQPQPIDYESITTNKPLCEATIGDLMGAFRTLLAGVRLDIRLSPADGERATERRTPRPYDTEGRLSGYRGMAAFLGVCVGTVTRYVKEGRVRTYKVGRKVYAYGDELLEDFTEIADAPAVAKVMRAKGYEQRKTWKPQ